MSECECTRLRLQLDMIEGWATRQAGELPKTCEEGWSTALAAAMARVDEAERYAVAAREEARP